MAQLVKRPTRDFASGHDHRAGRLRTVTGPARDMDLLKILPLPLPLPSPSHSLSFQKKQRRRQGQVEARWH